MVYVILIVLGQFLNAPIGRSLRPEKMRPHVIVDSREFGKLADNPKVSLDDIRALDQWRDIVSEYVKDYVSLNQFVA